jgi:hypothetical protein
MAPANSDSPVGFPAGKRKAGVRRPLAEMIQFNSYDQSKDLSDREKTGYLRTLRRRTKPSYPGKGSSG